MNQSDIIENISIKLTNAFFAEAEKYRLVVTENNLFFGMRHAAGLLNKVLANPQMDHIMKHMKFTNVDWEQLI